MKNIRIYTFLLFISMFFYVVNSANGVDMDFGFIFNNASTEQGKQDVVPTYQGTNIPETGVSSDDLNNKAYSNLDKNEAGSFINDSFAIRPKYYVEKDVNLISNAQNSIDNKEALINKDYSDCTKIIEYKMCYNKGRNIPTETETYNKFCNLIPVVKCAAYYNELSENLQATISVARGSYSYNNGIFTLRSSNYSNIDITATIIIGNITGVTLNLNQSGYAHSPQLIINGVQRPFGSGDITAYFRNGVNTMRIYEGRCGIASHISSFDFRFYLKGVVCRQLTETIQENCDTVYSNEDCKYKETVCVEGGGTRTFEGLNLTKDCWQNRKIHQCTKTREYAEDCSSMNLDECILDSKKYLDKDNKVEQFIYKCIRENPNPTATCNPVIDCLDGSCNDLEPAQNNLQDMLDAIAMLSTLNESVKTIDVDSLTMLNGENLKCRKSTGAVASFRDCCGDENWGNPLASCNSKEEKLKEKRSNSDCISIGSYCSEEIDVGLTKVCIEKKHSYCCFNNKFSKIIGNATRQQGLQTWGNAENTNCAGILIEQLQYLDFSKIDFSELYNDIKSSVNQTEINDRVKQSLERLQNGN